MKKDLLKNKVRKIFRRHGLSDKHSEICTNYLIKAELVEAKSHGLIRLKMYCDRIKKKLINPKPKIKIKKISSSISHINADNSIGFVAADVGINHCNQILSNSFFSVITRETIVTTIFNCN